MSKLHFEEKIAGEYTPCFKYLNLLAPELFFFNFNTSYI